MEQECTRHYRLEVDHAARQRSGVEHLCYRWPHLTKHEGRHSFAKCFLLYPFLFFGQVLTHVHVEKSSKLSLSRWKVF